jgi:multidrug resistance protein
MQRDFNSHDSILATFSMSIYVLGFSVGPLLFAPLSEVYGRVIIYRCCLAIFFCFTVACALSSSIKMLVGFRFFAGCFGAAPVAIGGAMVYDLFSIDERGVAMAVYHSGPIFGNLLGPPLGGFIIQYRSWRWVFWLIAICVRISAFRSGQFHVLTPLRLVLRCSARSSF